MRSECIDLQNDIDADPKNPSGQRLWLVEDINEETENEADVIVHVAENADEYLTFPVVNAMGVLPKVLTGRIHLLSIKPGMLGGGKAVAVCVYGLRDSVPSAAIGGESPMKNEEDGGPSGDEILGPEWTFDIDEGTQHITALDRREIGAQTLMARRYALTKNDLGETIDAPDLDGAIGVSRDKVEGVDVGVSVVRKSVTISGVPVTRNFIKYLRTMRGTVNLTKIDDLEPEEQKFVSASLRCRAGEGWVVTYNFLVGEAVENAIVGDFTLPEVKPFDHVWAQFKDVVESGDTAQKPKAVYVDRVCFKAEHAGLFEEVP